MQFTDTSQFGVAQVKLLFQPGQFGRFALGKTLAGSCAQKVKAVNKRLLARSKPKTKMKALRSSSTGEASGRDQSIGTYCWLNLALQVCPLSVGLANVPPDHGEQKNQVSSTHRASGHFCLEPALHEHPEVILSRTSACAIHCQTCS